MNCLHPYLLRGNHEDMLVPCMRCILCRISKRNEWVTRLENESLYWSKQCFVTLTYDDLHLPITGSLSPYHLRLFFRYLRRALPKSQKIKYFACGEYGGKFNRPHYHAIIFGYERRVPSDEPVDEFLEGVWNKGIVHYGSATHDSMMYTAKYVFKSYVGKKGNNEFVEKGINPPFRCSSLGLGLRFAIDNKDSILRDLSVRSEGKKVGLPLYYKRKLEIDSSLLYEASIKAAKEKSLKLEKRFNVPSGSLRQKYLDSLARKALEFDSWERIHE